LDLELLLFLFVCKRSFVNFSNEFNILIRLKLLKFPSVDKIDFLNSFLLEGKLLELKLLIKKLFFGEQVLTTSKFLLLFFRFVTFVFIPLYKSGFSVKIKERILESLFSEEDLFSLFCSCDALFNFILQLILY